MSERDAMPTVVCPRCGGTNAGVKDTGLSMCFKCGVFWGWRAVADDSAKAPLEDETAFACSALSGVIRKTPVVTTSHLEAIGTLRYGLSVHCGVIVVWDEDHDERVLRMIEERFPTGSVKPLAVCEHEGGICILWASEDDAIYAAPEDYTTENDWWNPTHYFRDGADVKEARHDA